MSETYSQTHTIMTAFEEVLKVYLDKVAQSDLAFAKKYANPEKSLQECARFIYGEVYHAAKPKKEGNVAAVAYSQKEVYGLALHYYDEPGKVKVRPISGLAETKTETVKAAPGAKNATPANKPANPKTKTPQAAPEPPKKRKPTLEEEFAYGFLFNDPDLAAR